VFRISKLFVHIFGFENQFGCVVMAAGRRRGRLTSNFVNLSGTFSCILLNFVHSFVLLASSIIGYLVVLMYVIQFD
jgi:hypothetical protein